MNTISETIITTPVIIRRMMHQILGFVRQRKRALVQNRQRRDSLLIPVDNHHRPVQKIPPREIL